MKAFAGVFRYEYSMSIRRWSLWLTFGILTFLFLSPLLMPPDLAGQIPAENEVLLFAATNSFMFNLFMPVVGGILAADRLVRDQKLGVSELLNSTALNRGTYLVAKYLGTLFSITTPVLLCSLLLGASIVARGGPLSILPAMVLAFLCINLPAYVFVVAFSLACPLVMPVRVYQVLFTGYWFWGNYLSPEFFPTLNGTYLTPSGHFALHGLIGGFYGGGGPNYNLGVTQLDAVINLAVLAAFAALALFAADRWLSWRAARA